MHEYDWKSLWLHLQAPHGPHLSITTKTTLNFHTICQSLGTPFLKGNWMMCCKETHPLLFKCLMTFLRCIKMIGRSSDSIYKPVMVNTVSFLQKQLSNFMQHVKLLWAPLETWNVLLWCKKRHPMMLGWFMTFLRCMSMIRGASDSIWKPRMVHTLSFLPQTTV